MNSFFEENLATFLIAVCVAAAAALLVAGYLYASVRRLRRDQRAVMGENETRDLVAHAHAVQRRVSELEAEIARLEKGVMLTGKRLDDCLTFRSAIRYDAYRDLSGMQSTSVALLDTKFSGMVISSIQGRDHARIYVKEIFHGESKEKLAPEEIQVLKEAMGLTVSEGSLREKGGRDA